MKRYAPTPLRRLGSHVVRAALPGGAGVSIRWLRIDGGQALNAAPQVLGIKGGTLPAEVPDDLTLGAVDSEGVETEAAAGTFPDGMGYGTLFSSTDSPTRVFIRNAGSTVLSQWSFLPVGTTTASTDEGRTLTLWIVSP